MLMGALLSRGKTSAFSLSEERNRESTRCRISSACRASTKNNSTKTSTRPRENHRHKILFTLDTTPPLTV